LCVTQGKSCGDAGSRVVGAEEDSENTDGPAAHHRSPPFQTFGQEVDSQGDEPYEGNLDDMEPHEPSPLFYGTGHTGWMRMKDLQDGESERAPEQDDPAPY